MAGNIRQIIILRLVAARQQQPLLQEAGLLPLMEEVEGPLIPVLASMEQAGILEEV